MSITVRCVWDAACQLGEGPLWHQGTVWFVDIKAGALLRHDPATGAQVRVAVAGNPSFLAPTTTGDWVIGSRLALHRSDGSGLGDAWLTVPGPAHNRTNDATVDGSGRLWFGTMDDNESAPTGRFFSLAGGVLIEHPRAAVVTNGPAVSTDGTTIYCVDSGAQTIWRHRIAPDGSLDAGAVFVALAPGEGYPDGVVLDAQGCLWVALWDGWAVRRYAPDGTLLLTVPMPVARPTKVAFGGADLTTAYVTSARVGLDAAALAGQPLAGGLFAFDAPAPGLPANLFAG